MTGKAAPVHPRLTPKETPEADLIQIFIAKNGVTKPTTTQEQRYARKEERARGLLTANNPSAYRFRPGSEAFAHRSTLMSEGFTLDHKPLPLEKLTGKYAEEPHRSPHRLCQHRLSPSWATVRIAMSSCHADARTDALYCSDAHRKAAARRAAKIAEANKAFKADLSIAENARHIANLSGEYSCFAVIYELESRATRHRGYLLGNAARCSYHRGFSRRRHVGNVHEILLRLRSI